MVLGTNTGYEVHNIVGKIRFDMFLTDISGFVALPLLTIDLGHGRRRVSQASKSCETETSDFGSRLRLARTWDHYEMIWLRSGSGVVLTHLPRIRQGPILEPCPLVYCPLPPLRMRTHWDPRSRTVSHDPCFLSSRFLLAAAWYIPMYDLCKQ
ncbi:hypothetical protein BDW75DRAFT_482 [Aspergillus navahoensis]